MAFPFSSREHGAPGARLLDTFEPMAAALGAMGLSEDERRAEIAALFGHCVGLLVLQHTKRMKLFGQAAEVLFGDYLDRLCERATARGERSGRGQI